MWLRRLVFLTLVFAFTSAFADERPLFISKAGKIPLWLSAEHKSDEAPLQMVEEGDLLTKEDAKGDFYLVVTKTNIKGWVEASKVRVYEKATGTVVNLNDIKVNGALDNPGDVYILTDDSKIPPEGFYILRDMTALILSDPIDRETLERKNKENF